MVNIIFGATNETLDFSHGADLSRFFLIGGIVVGSIILLTMIIFLCMRNYEVFVLGFMMCLIAMVPVSAITAPMAKTPPKAQVHALQTWVEDTYLVDLSFKETKTVMANQINVTGKDNSQKLKDEQTYVASKDVYGNKVTVGLIQDGSNWELIVLQNVAVTTK